MSEENKDLQMHRGKVLSAEIINDDQPSVIYEAVEFEIINNINHAPAKKIGKELSEEIMSRLEKLKKPVEHAYCIKNKEDE